MQKYIVGGAIRDALLKLPVTEKDWVITGSNPQELLAIGYAQVGKDFPVFLDPQYHEEYALARTERKSGQGYTGFTCYFDSSVTIEEDLFRRDLTINAMAYDVDGNIIDPYNGQNDIKLKILRHVSYAFNEDPLRVLRVARFAAKFSHIGFTIHPETFKLMIQMTHELQSLSPERVWTETKKALLTNHPHIYFQVLQQCGALKILFPELNILFNTYNYTQHNTHKKNLGFCMLTQLSNIASLSKNLSIRFSILCSNLGKQNFLTQKKYTHHDFYISEQLVLINKLCKRLKVSNKIYKLTKIVTICYYQLQNLTQLSPNSIISIFDMFNCWRYPNKIEQIICINKFHTLNNKLNTSNPSYQEKFIRTAFENAIQIRTKDIIRDGFTGKNIRKELCSRRLKILSTFIKNK